MPKKIKAPESWGLKTKYDEIDRDKCRVSFSRHIEKALEIEHDGMDVYSVCLAKEIRKACELEKLENKKSKQVATKIDDDEPIIFTAAMDIMGKSLGAMSPENLARSFLSAYMKMGMSVSKAVVIAHTPGFTVI